MIFWKRIPIAIAPEYRFRINAEAALPTGDIGRAV
jgi:hypothetical protein